MTDTLSDGIFNPVEMIIRLHHAEIIIERGKEDVARAFYCDLLGLRELAKPPGLSGNGGLWMQLGGNQIHLSIQDGYDPRSTKSHLAYEVTSLEAMKARLEENGVEVTMNEPIPGYIRGNVRDPFGNRIEFLQAVDSE